MEMTLLDVICQIRDMVLLDRRIYVLHNSIVILRDASGRLLGQYPAQSVPFQLPILLGPGEYVWVVVTWNSLCGAAVSEPARFRSSGMVP